MKQYYQKTKQRTTHWQKYTQEELTAQLKALGKKFGRKPTDGDINRACKLGKCASAATYARMFGGLPAAYIAAGFTELVKNQLRYTDEQIVAALRKLKRELGRVPGFHDLEAASADGKCPSPGTVVRRLGNLTEIRSRL